MESLMTRSRRVGEPRLTRVHARAGGIPMKIDGTAVESIREQWVVEDRWWTPRPVRRRYFELVLGDGRNVVVFRDLVSRRWFSQRS
jgi:hypothetical protein